jgi:hypothetical protein
VQVQLAPVRIGELAKRLVVSRASVASLSASPRKSFSIGLSCRDHRQ